MVKVRRGVSAVINVEYIDEDGSISSNVEKIVGTQEEVTTRLMSKIKVKS